MGQKSAITPAFSAGPLLMPPIQLQGISGHAAGASLGRTFPQPSFAMPSGRTRFSFWPCLRQFGNRCLYGARVVPLTLSSIIREDRSGSPALLRNEQGRWVPGARKPPVRAGIEAAEKPVRTRVAA